MRPSWSKYLFTLIVAALNPSQAEPLFEIGTGAGDGSEPIAVRVFFDGEGTHTTSGSVTFSFDNATLTASRSCVSQTGDPLPDRLNFTHRVSCTVDNFAGTVRLSFSPLFMGATISRRVFLGRIFFEVPTDFVPAPGGSIFALPITSITLPTSDGLDSGNGSLMVLRAWPIDGFEDDDFAVVASDIGQSSVGIALNAAIGEEHFVQPHSFDVANDEDWMFFQQVCVDPPPAVDIRVSPIAPFSTQQFRPSLEIYPADRLTDPTILPLLTLGSCETPSSADLVAQAADFEGSRLLRLRNCVDPPASGIGYSLRISKSNSCLSSGAFRYSGKVVESGSGLPVQAFLKSDANVFSVSDEDTGEYRILGFIDPPEIEVISDQFQPGPFQFSGVIDGLLPDIVVTRKSLSVFASGFEQTPGAQN